MGKVFDIDFKYLSGSSEQQGPTNEYTGSLPAVNGTTGIFADIFRYRVWCEVDDDKLPTAIIAAWYFGCYAYEFTDKELITHETFEASEDGAKAAVEWLQQAYDNAPRAQ